MNRDMRKIINSKENKIAILDHYPGPKNVPEGSFLVAHPRGKPVRLYKKLKGMLWWKNFTRDGNEVVDKDLKIGKNLTIGRHRKEVLQPSFLAYNSASDANISVASNVTVDFDTEVFDIGNNFSGDIFTAPVTGKYFLQTNVSLFSIDTAAGYYSVIISTSNRDYHSSIDPNLSGDTGAGFPWTISVSCVADMDKDDTARVYVYQSSGTSQTDIFGHATQLHTFFSGYLLG